MFNIIRIHSTEEEPGTCLTFLCLLCFRPKIRLPQSGRANHSTNIEKKKQKRIKGIYVYILSLFNEPDRRENRISIFIGFDTNSFLKTHPLDIVLLVSGLVKAI